MAALVASHLQRAETKGTTLRDPARISWNLIKKRQGKKKKQEKKRYTLVASLSSFWHEASECFHWRDERRKKQRWKCSCVLWRTDFWRWEAICRADPLCSAVKVNSFHTLFHSMHACTNQSSLTLLHRKTHQKQKAKHKRYNYCHSSNYDYYYNTIAKSKKKPSVWFTVSLIKDKTFCIYISLF